MSKLTELNQELHALRETQFGAIKEMKDTFEGGSEISGWKLRKHGFLKEALDKKKFRSYEWGVDPQS